MKKNTFTPNGERKIKVEEGYVAKLKQLWKYAVENIMK